MAEDMILYSVEGREVASSQGIPTVQLLTDALQLPVIPPAIWAFAPALAAHGVPRALEVDLQLALAWRRGAGEVH